MAQPGVPMAEALKDQFEDIWQATQGVSRERFDKAIDFGILIMRGYDKYRAYERVFGECSEVYTQTISFMASRYVNMILERLQDMKYNMLLDKHLRVLEEMYDLATSDEVSHRTKIDASRTYLEMTKRPDALKVDVTHNHNIGVELKQTLDEVLKAVSNNGRMVLPDGSVTDAEVILE
jgi:hypothetical protein